MTGSPSQTVADQVERINAELADLFGCAPAPLRTGSTLRGYDGLVVCGLVGGKDAGKSTLINALADRRVSVDAAIVGEGTPRPIAYTHEDDVDALRRRLGSGDAGPIDHQLVTHRVDTIHRLVLVDLPDIDSTFHEHLETVHRAVERMDRVIWVFDPKKGDDRMLARLLPRIVRDPANVYCVLNKFDGMLKDATNGDGADAFWDVRDDWFRACLQSLGLNPDGRRRFLISAKYPDPNAFARAAATLWLGDPDCPLDEPDRSVVRRLGARCAEEISRLKAEILTPLTVDEARLIKHANESAEVTANIADILAHCDLQNTTDRAIELLPEIDRHYARQFDDDYVITVAQRLARTGRSEVELARELMAHRVERWPVLPVLYWPLAGLVRWWGRRLVAAKPTDDPPWALGTTTIRNLLRVRGRGLGHRTASLHESACGAGATLPDNLLPTDRMPDPKRLAANAAARITERCETLDDDVLAACKAAERAGSSRLRAGLAGSLAAPPGRLARFLIWFVLIWFPLLQPLLKGGLLLLAEHSIASGLRAAMIVVSALGPGSLVKGLAASGLVLFIVLAVMFARAIRDVRRERGSAVGQRGDATLYVDDVLQILTDEIRAPVREPVEWISLQLQRCLRELNELRGALR